MANYIHLFENNKEFNNSSKVSIPNVSFVENLDLVSYNKYSNTMLLSKPLTFKFLSDGTFEIKRSSSSTQIYFSFRYTHKRGTEILSNNVSASVVFTKEVLKNDEISITASSTPVFYDDYYGYIYFGGTAKCIMYGNFSSLFTSNYNGSNSWSLSTNCTSLFRGYDKLDIDPNNFNFGRISNITSTGIFRNCFMNCTSLTNFPILPFKTLPEHAYDNMFKGCKKLKKITALFTTDISDTDLYTKGWLDGVSEKGTFIKSRNATWENRGPNGIPENWNVGKYID